MRLIPDWRLAWRFMSVQAALLLTLLSGIQADVLPIVRPLFPDHSWPWISGGLAMLVVVLRLLAQPGLELPRAQLELDRIDEEPAAPPGQLMPAGRLERYLGAALVLFSLALCLAFGLFIWHLVRFPL